MGIDLHLSPAARTGSSSGAEHRVPQTDYDQLKGQFLASLNHELRTPLSGVLGMTDLLLETRLDTEQQEYVGTIRECASQLLEALNAVLDYSALSAGNLAVQQSEFVLPAVLEAVAADGLGRAEAKGLRLVTEWDDSIPETVEGDERYLRQALQNIVRNAVKFTSRGQVEIAASIDYAPGRLVWLTVRVRDTGIGISAEKLRLIFESFRQLDSGLARSYTGLGLGLALTDKLVRMMGGEIQVESEAGKGSTFTVRVPLLLSVGSRDRDAAAGDDHNSRRRILVVEDNRIAQQVVGHVLRRAGYELAFADNGETGVRLAGAACYDLILMDLQMPGMDGFETTQAIRRIPACRQTPIIALTANFSDEYRSLCQQAGMQGFLAKPVQKEELLRTIQAYAPARR